MKDLSQINNIELVRKFEDRSRVSLNGAITDFLGCKTLLSHYNLPITRSGEILNFPNPDDTFLHDFYEYIGSCLAYDLSTQLNTFTMMELGAGNGIWSARSGIIMKRMNCKLVNLYTIEASPDKIPFIKENFELNNIKTNTETKIEIKIINAAITANEKKVFFPKISNASVDYGATVQNSKQHLDYRGFENQVIEIEGLPIKELLKTIIRIDLMHVDIQGSEFEVLNEGILDLNSKVKIIVIGTHSRDLEGKLFSLFMNNKWTLYLEKPCRFKYDLNIPTLEGMTIEDGAQIWVNTSISD